MIVHTVTGVLYPSTCTTTVNTRSFPDSFLLIFTFTPPLPAAELPLVLVIAAQSVPVEYCKEGVHFPEAVNEISTVSP